ncbi:cbb3-type cytochrome oxidase assembly protein CcoS [Thauera sp. CAU 1555]|uniref:Cbb3-type cytochrome oxidase assembly protein CcoS n=1 Tax=Thauera sedimentorum TaxID=2767595 RepID=A0ABR9B6K2_9RHOO|nr:cbb3-type cytochrome oxidase assembly protein CcoS [Thauera sedimentorum]MBC9070610.1 cbb3-type cytochrome oxidase assembly protein CcoS [Thauera sedimentorum]MBD8501529.1 cbb3-type cytochrome oxidase assembly protein CcoS [Thauera sedimentorum]
MDDLLGSLYILIPLSVVLVFVIGVIFWWSVRSGQFDDMEGPAYRLLMDDRDPPAADAAAEDGPAARTGEQLRNGQERSGNHD